MEQEIVNIDGIDIILKVWGCYDLCVLLCVVFIVEVMVVMIIFDYYLLDRMI